MHKLTVFANQWYSTFDTDGCVTGMASGLRITECCYVGELIGVSSNDMHMFQSSVVTATSSISSLANPGIVWHSGTMGGTE